MSSRTARARVYRAVIETGSGYREEPIDWVKIFEDLSGRPPAQTTFDQTIFAPALVPEGPTLLGLHTPIDTRGWTEIAPHASTVEDLLSPADEGDDENEEGPAPAPRFARSTAVLPLDAMGYLAIAHSGGNGPGAGKLKTFLTTVQPPQGDGEKWVVRPVMDESRVLEFFGAGRAQSFSTSFPVDHDLLSIIPEDEQDPHGNIFTMGRSLAEATGVSVFVDVTVRLAPESADNLAAQQAVVDEVRKDAERLLRRESGAHALTVLPTGEVVDLNLVPDAMARSFPLESSGPELLTFRHTCQGLANLAETLNADVAARDGGH